MVDEGTVWGEVIGQLPKRLCPKCKEHGKICNTYYFRLNARSDLKTRGAFKSDEEFERYAKYIILKCYGCEQRELYN